MDIVYERKRAIKHESKFGTSVVESLELLLTEERKTISGTKLQKEDQTPGLGHLSEFVEWQSQSLEWGERSG